MTVNCFRKLFEMFFRLIFQVSYNGKDIQKELQLCCYSVYKYNIQEAHPFQWNFQIGISAFIITEHSGIFYQDYLRQHASFIAITNSNPWPRE